MRIANLDHRLVLLAGDGCIDVATASQGRFSADPQAVRRSIEQPRDERQREEAGEEQRILECRERAGALGTEAGEPA